MQPQSSLQIVLNCEVFCIILANDNDDNVDVLMQRVLRGSTVLAAPISVDVNTLMAVTRSPANASVNPAGLDQLALKVSLLPLTQTLFRLFVIDTGN